ncbi:MAG: hypothetical protein ABR599_12620 [Gemmatimonadota bacterium]
MKRLYLLAWLVSAGLLLGAPGAFAQEEEGEEEMVAAAQAECPFICAPVFLFMPGFLGTNIIDPPETADGDEAESDTNFLLRFQVVAPTFIPRVSLVALTQWTPFNTVGTADDPNTPDVDEEEFEANAPAFVYGLIITLLTSQYLDVSFDPLMLYSGAAKPDDSAQYTHKFTLELALVPKLGTIMNATEGSFLGGLGAYLLLDYVVTGLPDADESGGEEFEPDPWAILGGLIIPFAPFAGT